MRCTGNKNQYTKTSASLKNPFKESSSIVGKAFLLKDSFKNQKELIRFINDRLTALMDQAAVSRAINGLIGHMMISKDDNNHYKLIDRDGLLQGLAKNYKDASKSTYCKWQSKSAAPRCGQTFYTSSKYSLRKIIY